MIFIFCLAQEIFQISRPFFCVERRVRNFFKFQSIFRVESRDYAQSRGLSVHSQPNFSLEAHFYCVIVERIFIEFFGLVPVFRLMLLLRTREVYLSCPSWDICLRNLLNRRCHKGIVFLRLRRDVAYSVVKRFPELLSVSLPWVISGGWLDYRFNIAYYWAMLCIRDSFCDSFVLSKMKKLSSSICKVVSGHVLGLLHFLLLNHPLSCRQCPCIPISYYGY